MNPFAFRAAVRRIFRSGFILAAVLATCAAGRADQNYSQQVFFENSLSPRSFFYSQGKADSPSTLELVTDRLPVESGNFVSGPNSLRLSWKSMPGGGWSVELHYCRWRNRMIFFPGTHLYLWLYAEQGLKAADLPPMALRDLEGNFTQPLDWGKAQRDIPAHTWTRVGIPLQSFVTASLHPFDPRHLTTLVLVQGNSDAVAHTLLLDDIRVEDEPGRGQVAPPTPEGLVAKGYERHIDLTWKGVENPSLAQYVIYRSIGREPFRAIGVQRPGVNRYCDYTGDPGVSAVYRVTARTSSLRESAPSATATATTRQLSDEELLTMVQEASFRYYWEADEPHSGMTRENTPGDDDVVALGASGFGIMAIIVGAERGFITHQQAIERLQQITTFLSTADRYHGGWPHFLSGSTGRRLPVFGMYDNGADLVETSFLMEGLLAARQYFRNDGASGQALYQQITKLWEGVEWDWFQATPHHDALYWHWSPEYSFYIANRLTGWNEVMITYLEAIASPTHGIPASDYYSGWVGEGIDNPYANGRSYFGITLPVGGNTTGGPLFFTDYSYMGFNPHDFHDRFTNYYENNRAQAEINQQYAIHNPHHWKGYGENTWGLTAVDGPDGYVPYEPTADLDDGTIAPTGAISAYAYTPGASLEALKHFYRDLGAQVWSIYGFRDAFNLQQDWYSGITMGLNQAPMAVMIENQRSGVVWKSFMANPEIMPMIERIQQAGASKTK